MARPLRTNGQPSLRTLCAAAGTLLWSLLPAHACATTAMAAAGGMHSLLLTRDGTVWAWGSNFYGQLGTGSREDAYRPLPILDLGKADFIATGRRHSLAVKADGTVWGWGDNEYGQLGTGDTAPRTLPTQIAGLGDVVAVAGAREHSVALRRDGTVWAWGNNLAGQLGTGTEETTVSTPLPVPELSDIVAIAAGDGYTLALARNGTLWGWGANGRCQLGDEGTAVHASPIRIPGVSDVVAISASTSHNIALRKDGAVLNWGSSLAFGEQHCAPTAVAGVSDAKGVVAGADHYLLTKANGALWSWGDGSYGQLGDGTTAGRSAPGEIKDLKVAAVAAGSSHTVAVGHDGTVWAWGNNVAGQTGTGSGGEQAPRTPLPTQVLDRKGTAPLNAQAASTENLPPTAHDLSAVIAAGTSLRGQITATDAEYALLTFRLVTDPEYGTVNLARDGTFEYTPAAGFAGTDSFRFTVDDGNLQSNVALAQIAVVDCAEDKNPAYREESIAVSGNCALPEAGGCDLPATAGPTAGTGHCLHNNAKAGTARPNNRPGPIASAGRDENSLDTTTIQAGTS